MKGNGGTMASERGKHQTRIDRDFLEQVTKELDDARNALHAAMTRPHDDKWHALACAAMSKAHNTIVWAIHKQPFHAIHARNWRERHALEQGSGSGEEAA
jgi:hypothetical protein